MSKRLNKFAPTLHYLATCDSQSAKSVIKHAKPQLVNCFSDICHNLLKGKVRLSTKEKNRLTKYRSHIRRVAKKHTTKATKKKLIQTGGFLSAVLAPLLGTVLGPLVQGIFGRKA